MSETEKTDIKKMIVEELKKEGLNVAEDAAVSMVKAVLKIVPKVVSETENKVDDLLIAIVPVIEPSLMDLLDKIDGEEG
jgi:predicted histidine transporter YuiF (NhaC family)